MNHFFSKTLLWLAMALPFQSMAQFNMNEITFWIGSGSHSAALVIDFNDANNPQCFAWGYRFDDPATTAEDMIKAIDSVDNALQVSFSGGFLPDISYLSHSGIGGSPDYFASFFGDGDSTNWTMNMGTSELMTDSAWFGLSYTAWDTSFNPLYVPGLPVAASPVNGIASLKNAHFSLWPNPVASGNNVVANFDFESANVYDSFGRLVLTTTENRNRTIELSGLLNACYNIVFLTNEGNRIQQTIVVQ